MMRFERRGSGANEEPLNITAMVDVVFVLLAFFVLNSQFVLERDVVMGVEQGADSAGAVETDLPEEVRVRLRASGVGEAPGITIGRTALPAGDYEAIRAHLAEIDVPAIPVVVEPDAQVSVEAVARVMEAVLGSPMREVSLEVRER